MVIAEPWYPGIPWKQPWTTPQPYPEVCPIVTGTYTVERIKEVEKKWKEKHIKNVKKGIFITFEGDEEPLFIATDDACFQKIMDAIKDEKTSKKP